MTKRWVFSLSIFLLGAVAQADFNFMVQGRLSDNSGNPIGTPTAVEWRLFRDGDPATTGGTPVYTETGLITPINPQGVFSYELGSGTPVGSPLDASAYTGSNPLYALLSVAGTPLLPKLRVTPVPRSHVATLAESVQAGGVDTAALQDGSVTGVKIATSSISGSHVSGTAQLNVDRIGLGGAPATSLDLSSKTDAVRLPTGTSAERPGTPANGDTRYNSTLNAVESYVNGSWQTLSTDAGTGTAGTYTKVTTDANGRVTAGDTLAAGDIPNLDAAKITSGVLDAARIPAGTDSGKLPLTGGTMSGSIDLGGNNVTNAGTIAASTVTVGGNNVISTNAPLTSGSVLFANGAASAGQDNSNLFWDNTNKRLGVGTSNPGQPLTISAYDNSAGNYQSRKAVLRTVNTSNSTANSRFSGIQFAFRDTDAQVVAAVGAVLTDTVSDWSGDLVFATKANGFVESLTEYMRLASGGNLGIGITAPTAKLHLRSGTSAANTAPLKFTAGTNLTTPEAGAVEFDGTNLYFSSNTTNRQTFAFQGSAGTLSGLTSGSVLFANGAASAGQDNGNLFWDNTNKRLGIGTGAPLFKVQILENGATSQPSGTFTGGLENKTLMIQGSGGAYIAGKDTTNNIEFAMGVPVTGAAFAGSMTSHNFQLRTGNVPRLTIQDSNGNIGIGVTSPTSLLHLKGGTAAANTAPLKFTAGTNLTTPEAGAVEFDGTNLYFSSNTTNRQTFAFQGSAGTLSGLTSGSVLFANSASSAGQDNSNFFWDNTNKRLGIGLVNPGYAFDVVGDVQFRANVFMAGLGTHYIKHQSGTASTDKFTFRFSDNEDVLTVAGDGNVGIGTTSPKVRFQSSGSASVTSPTLGVASGGFYLTNADTNYGLLGGVSVVGNAWLQAQRTDASAVAYNLNLQPSGGKVGIGVTSPSGKLDVSGGTYALVIGADNAADTRTDATSKSARLGGVHYLAAEEPVGMMFLEANSANNNLNLGGGSSLLNAATTINFFTASNYNTVTGTKRMTITAAGEVGIGSIAPSAMLDVNQTVAGSVAVQGQNAGTVFWKVVSPAGGITGGYNAADAVEYVAKDSVTGRSINAAGTINANGADFAEWVDWEGPKPEVGSIVFYKGVHVVISSTRTAAFVGNDVKDPAHAMLVAFAGQLPVLVKGNVQEGDLIVANPDGTGRAVSRDLATMAEIQTAVGTAWASSNDSGIKRVNVAVGLGLAGGRWVDNKIKRLEGENAGLKAENKSITQRLEQIEKLLSQIKK